MCGIVGFFGGDFTDFEANNSILEKMSDQIITRGPDSAGTWLNTESKIALGHRRLAIVDLSPAGFQPMTSASGRYMITYNGEIYNSDDIRNELAKSRSAPSWCGHSDTETLLAGFDAWGIKDTISRATGMFAMAIWDKGLQQLTLVRDRVGEKPLYYGWQGSGPNKVFLFGSELKALKHHPQFKKEIDRKSLALYMRYSYVPTPYSIYKDISKVEPGTIITIASNGEKQTTEKYWSTLDVIRRGFECPFDGTVAEVTNNLDIALRKTVSQQMTADVPLGAFLSGGVDSSVVVALMQDQSSRPIKTFTIGFKETGYDEAECANLVASHLGTDHTELYASPKDALDIIPKLPHLYCEPFADSSQIPTYLVASLARTNVTVSLSGDGGDELFCGYNRYLFTDKLWKGLNMTPATVRNLVGKSISSVPAATWNKTFELLNNITPTKFDGIRWADKIQKGARVISARNLTDLYQRLVSNWQDPATIVINNFECNEIFSTNIQQLDGVNEIQKMMAIDMLSYLPDDILVKVDRAAMGVSLETRVPFLDHNIIEFASRIPISMKLNKGVGKAILRDTLYKYVPKELIERPKMGFSIPLGDWLKGPLKDWAEDLLDESRLRTEGFFHPIVVRKMWLEHLTGQRNWHSQLWAVLMFQAWLEDNM